MNKKCFKSERFKPSRLYSNAVYASRVAFLSGMGPTNPETGEIVSQDFKEQACQTIENIKLLLDEMGLGLTDVVKTNVYLSDIANFDRLNEVYTSYFTESLPARTTVQAAGLPGGIQVEIELVVAAGEE